MEMAGRAVGGGIRCLPRRRGGEEAGAEQCGGRPSCYSRNRPRLPENPRIRASRAHQGWAARASGGPQAVEGEPRPWRDSAPRRAAAGGDPEAGVAVAVRRFPPGAVRQKPLISRDPCLLSQAEPPPSDRRAPPRTSVLSLPPAAPIVQHDRKLQGHRPECRRCRCHAARRRSRANAACGMLTLLGQEPSTRCSQTPNHQQKKPSGSR